MTVTTTAPHDTVRLFHALSDPTRMEILERLRAGERCVCELVDVLDASQSRLSFHLRVLKDAGLVRDRRQGRWVYYTLETVPLEAMRRALHHLAEPSRHPAPRRNDDACCT
jgi:ArsR family transcriptional regulator, arsenate/arsenite/antimonite-responsive transcriptional repressor